MGSYQRSSGIDQGLGCYLKDSTAAASFFHLHCNTVPRLLRHLECFRSMADRNLSSHKWNAIGNGIIVNLPDQSHWLSVPVFHSCVDRLPTPFWLSNFPSPVGHSTASRAVCWRSSRSIDHISRPNSLAIRLALGKRISDRHMFTPLRLRTSLYLWEYQRHHMTPTDLCPMSYTSPLRPRHTLSLVHSCLWQRIFPDMRVYRMCPIHEG